MSDTKIVIGVQYNRITSMGSPSFERWGCIDFSPDQEIAYAAGDEPRVTAEDYPNGTTQLKLWRGESLVNLWLVPTRDVDRQYLQPLYLAGGAP